MRNALYKSTFLSALTLVGITFFSLAQPAAAQSVNPGTAPMSGSAQPLLVPAPVVPCASVTITGSWTGSDDPNNPSEIIYVNGSVSVQATGQPATEYEWVTAAYADCSAAYSAAQTAAQNATTPNCPIQDETGGNLCAQH